MVYREHFCGKEDDDARKIFYLPALRQYCRYDPRPRRSHILLRRSDAAHEKHVPVYQVHGNQVTVTVGEVAHPMTAEHYIEWICLQTKFASQHRKLEPNTPPTACFALCDGDAVERVYAFCNLHGLWQG